MSKMTTKDTTLQSTKQMLDELDVLMEQMLSLPVNDPEDVSSFPREVVKPHAMTATLTMLEAPAPISDACPLEPIAHPKLNAPHMTYSSLPTQLGKNGSSVPQPTPLTNNVTPISLLPQMEPLLAEIPDSSADATTIWVYQPLVWMNQAFDAGTMMFGGLGALLRTRACRMLLGLVGAACLIVSVGWFLKDWLGWNW